MTEITISDGRTQLYSEHFNAHYIYLDTGNEVLKMWANKKKTNYILLRVPYIDVAVKVVTCFRN